MRRDEELLDDATADQMFIDDSPEHRRIAAAVPRALGINDCDRTAFADSQAVRLRAKDAALLRQAKLPQAVLEELPRREATIFLTAFRLGLIAAEKDVPPRDRHADRRCGGPLRISDHNILCVVCTCCVVHRAERQTPNSSGSHSSPS